MDKKIIKSIIARQQELVCNVEFINTKPLFVSARDEVVGKHCRLVACQEIWGGRVFYYRRNVEVDFVVPRKSLAIQVAYDLDLSSTKSRETGSLVSLCKHMDNISHPLIVTMDTEETIDTDDLRIEVLPVWKWLINM